MSQFLSNFDQNFVPAEELLDPVNKLRTSQPQALIDTDFEYGLQLSKWENLGLINNRPFVYASPTSIPNITGISLPANSKTVTVTTSAAHNLTVGTAITVQDTYLFVANGNFIITGVTTTSPHTFTYTARALNTNSSITAILDSNKTVLYVGNTYSSAQIGGTITGTYSGSAITVTTTTPHGLSIGNEISVRGFTASTNAPNGAFSVSTVINSTQFIYYATAVPTGTLAGTATLFVRPQGQFLHRPFDGGTLFSANAASNNQQAIRQTRRYFRYQSGKGIQMSSGTVLKPNLPIESITSSGTLVTVQTKEQHNLEPGTVVRVFGVEEDGYNGSYTIIKIISFNTFQYNAYTTPASTIGSGNYYVTTDSWFGCSNRVGIFDSQNGLFFEYDGQQLYAVRRSSTYQLSGKVSVAVGSNTVTQTNAAFPTIFSRQASPGDFIVIRGMSYRIEDIASDTSMTISPAYRGTINVDYAIVSKTEDLKIPQSEWNIDTMDGNGPSGYDMDLTKMQMFYIDYSWYGAGFIRWGVRALDGTVKYCHKMINNNVNAEAYMRSGNLPARYESNTFSQATKATSSIASDATTINVASTSGFAPNGTLLVRNGNTYEYLNYSSKTATTFTGLTRAQAGGTTNVSIPENDNVGIVSSASGLQVGQRLIHPSFPEGTYISGISGTQITLNNAASTANPTGVIFAPMSLGGAMTFTHSTTSPISVEQAYPTFSASISHWGTSVIIDGRFDDDKSLVFTFGQTAFTSIPTGQSRSLFSIRVSPSVDNGTPAVFGARELINRMQLVLRSLDVTTKTANSNYLVTAVLNGTPSGTTAWTNAVKNVSGVVNSSLAQIADYSGVGNVTVAGGEVVGGFLSSGTNSIELDRVRDLGNSILGGGATTAASGVFPDGPDILTIRVENLSAASIEVLGRLSWTEAQA
jgi:hypothetical protein